MDIFCENCGKNLKAISPKQCDKRIKIESISGRESIAGKCKKCNEYRVFWHNYKGNKTKYQKYMARIKKGIPMSEAILPNNLKRIKIYEKGRICNKCGEFKTWDQFYKTSTTKSGHVGSCRTCKIKQKEQYRQTLWGKMKDYEYKRWYRSIPKNKQKEREVHRLWIMKNREKRRALEV